MNDPREPNNDEIQDPNDAITGGGDVEAFREPNNKDEPESGAEREPNTE